MPDGGGAINDVLLGYEDPLGYITGIGPNLGSTTGRFNQSDNFKDKNWTSKRINNGIMFTLHSEDGQDGYPGDLVATVSYILKADSGKLTVEYTGLSTKDTLLNMASNLLFNLAGHSSGSGTLRNHMVHVNMDNYFDDEGSPQFVAQTPWDLRAPSHLGKAMLRQQKWTWNEKMPDPFDALKQESQEIFLAR